MRAILLCAGRGRRLRPATQELPKCLLPVAGGRTVLDLQLAAIARCGVGDALVVAGFEARRVETHLLRNPAPGLETRLLLNPDFENADNLVSCQLATASHDGDFLVANGDTVFEDGVLRRLLDASSADAIQLGISRKAHRDDYDDDDMKVALRGDRLRAVSKALPDADVHAESIGVVVCRGGGAVDFRAALDRAVAAPDGATRWYLSALSELASRRPVDTVDVSDLWWHEIDGPADLDAVRAHYREGAPPSAPVMRETSSSSAASSANGS
jgi:choline kinase